MKIRFKNWLESTEINWTLPVVNQELSTIQNSVKSLKLNPEQLTIALNQAKLINLPNNVWSKVKNLNQSQSPQPKTNKQSPKTISPVSPQNVTTKVDLKAPIIIMNNNQPYMVSGSDSFQAARNLGTYPKALVASLG